MPRDWGRGGRVGKALLRGSIGKSWRAGPRDGALGLALGNAQGKAFGMALGIASGKALGLALGVALRRAFGMALGMAQGAIGKALGIAARRAIGKALWKALGMAPAKSHMHGPSASTAEHSPAGHIQTEPQTQPNTRLWTCHEKASTWLPKTCECIGFCLI